MTINGDLSVAKAILDRLRDVHVSIEPLLDSPVKAHATTLKGIDFRVKDVKAATQCFDKATDTLGRKAFYYNGQNSSGEIIRELVRNLPDLLDVSFAATDGYGYREIRDMPLLPILPSFLPKHSSSSFNSRFGFDDEQSVHFEVSSLHAAIGLGTCNVHIDQMGFTVRGPHGVFLNPDFPQHLVSELGVQTMASPFLGRLFNRVANLTHLIRTDKSLAIEDFINKNVSLELPNSRNGYRPGAGMSVKVTPRLTVSVKYTAKCNFCREQEQDYGIPIPGGWSVGGGITYRFGKKGR